MSSTRAFSKLLRLGLVLQAQAGSRNFKRRISRAITAAGLLLVAALLAGGAFAFGLDALWTFVQPIIGPVQASLAIAALLAVLAFFLMIAASRLTQGERRHQTGKPEAGFGAADIEQAIRSRKSLFLSAALLAGMLAASRSGADPAP